MKFRNILLSGVLILTFLNACVKNDVSKHVPSHIIKKEQMAEILADMQLADAGVTNEGLNQDSAMILRARFYYAILDKHDVTNEKFKESMDFYMTKPVLLQEVYDKVNEIINTLQGNKMED